MYFDKNGELIPQDLRDTFGGTLVIDAEAAVQELSKLASRDSQANAAAQEVSKKSTYRCSQSQCDKLRHIILLEQHGVSVVVYLSLFLTR